MPLEKKYKIGICLLCIALIVSSFLLVEFTIIKNEYSAHSDVETFAFGNPEVHVNEIYLYVEENNARLEQELVEMLQREGINILESATLKENYGNEVLLVAPLNEEKTYTPIYSKTTAEILFFYSISGTTKYFNEFKSGKSPVVRFSSEDGDQLIIKGDRNSYGY